MNGSLLCKLQDDLLRLCFYSPSVTAQAEGLQAQRAAETGRAEEKAKSQGGERCPAANTTEDSRGLQGGQQAVKKKEWM